MKVSILLTCYNFEGYIVEAINSLLNQNFDEEYEIILTDDGSTDNSPQIIQEIPKNSKLKIILNEQNLGVATTLNNAFNLATGLYICRFDGDDVWEPNFLKKMSQLLDEIPEIAMAYCNCSYIDGKSSITNENVLTRRKVTTQVADEFKHLVEDYYITAPTVIFRKEVLNKIFPLPSDLKFLDWLISLSIAQHNQIGYLSECLAKYRIHSQGMHITMVKDLYGEKTTDLILNRFLQDKRFNKEEKQTIRLKHAKTFIIRYFGNRMFVDTRRIVKEQLKQNGLPIFKDKQIAKYYIASHFGKPYNLIKSWIR